MKLLDRVSLRVDLIRIAKQASQEGLSAEDFVIMVVDMFGEDSDWDDTLVVFMRLLPLLLEWFRDK